MTNIKKKVYTKKPYININIKNENNQQSKNKYIKPPPNENIPYTPNINNITNERGNSYPLAYEPYNPLASNLWNDPEVAQQLQARGFRNANANPIRPPPEYDGPNADEPNGNVLGGRDGVNRFIDDDDDDTIVYDDGSRSSIYPPSNISREDDDETQSSIIPPSSILRNIEEEEALNEARLRQANKIMDLESFVFEDEDEDEEAGAAAGAPLRRPRGRPDITESERELARVATGRNNLTPQEYRAFSDNYRIEYQNDTGRVYRKEDRTMYRIWLADKYA